MAAFPKGDHDDDVDSTTQALNWMLGRGDARGFYRYAKMRTGSDKMAPSGILRLDLASYEE